MRGPSPEDNVGFVIRDGRGRAASAYFSGIAGPSPEVERALDDADVVFFDGTFWSSDELIAAGLGTRRAEDMAHWPIGGPEGSLRSCRGRGRTRDLHPHQQHQPDPARGQPEAARRDAAGVEIAHDGMELDL